MGFEQVVPPIPERLDEIKMLERLEKSWLEQPYYRYYMQEDIRQAKMNYSHYNLTARRKFLTNCLLLSLVTLPLAYWTRRFYVFSNFRSSGLPFVKELPYFTKTRTAEFDRSKAANKTFILTYFISTCLFSTVITNWNYRSDEFYDLFPKVEKML